MPSITLSIERELFCVRCSFPLFDALASCPDCHGSGVVLREFDCEVEYEFSRGCRGHCDRYGVPEEPDTPDEVSVAEDAMSDFGLVPLTEREIEQAEEKAFEDVRDRAIDAAEARAEARAESLYFNRCGQ